MPDFEPNRQKIYILVGAVFLILSGGLAGFLAFESGDAKWITVLYSVNLLLLIGACLCFFFLYKPDQKQKESHQAFDLLKASQKVKLSVLVAEIAHDIKNPLTVLMMNSSQLQSQVRKLMPHDAEALLKKTELNSRVLNRILDMMHALKARYEVQDFEVEIVEIRDIFIKSKILAEQRIQNTLMSVQYEDLQKSLLLNCCVIQIVQAFDNIILHEIEQMREATGSLHFRVDKFGDGRIHISVIVEGREINAEHEARYFESFLKSPNPTESEYASLELCLARRLIELNGGFLTLQEGPQTVYLIDLPLFVENAKPHHQKVS